MPTVLLNQPVMVFEDPDSCGEGGLLGCHGVVIGVDHREQTCIVELASGHRIRNVPFSTVRDVVGSRGIFDESGMSANGVYRSRTGRVAIFSFHKCDCDVVNYDIRLPNEPGLFPRIDVRVPRSIVITSEFVRRTLTEAFASNR